MKKTILLLLDIIIPRFVDERIAINRTSITQVTTVCLEKDITRDTVYTGVIGRRCFNFFGVGLFMTFYEVD